MKSLTLQDLLALQSPVTHWAVCWMVTDKLGNVLRQTNHDRDITVSREINGVDLSGLYESVLGIQSSLSRHTSSTEIDNLEIDILLEEQGITAGAIRAGIFDNVEYTLFLVNAGDPTDSGIVIRHGLVGNIHTFANDLAKGEGRGLKQYLTQVIVETYSLSCRAKLGDERCTVDLAPLTFAGEITGVTNRRVLVATLDGSPQPAQGYFRNGLLRFTSGDNAGFEQEVKLDVLSGSWTFTVFEPFPYGVEVGDEFEVEPGCNHLHSKIDGIWQGDCKDKFNNLPNFRGEPMTPGVSELMRGAA